MLMGLGVIGCFAVIREEFFDGIIFVAVGEFDCGFMIAHFALTGKFEEER